MTDNAYNSYAFTVRPTNGVDKDGVLQKAVETWCKKQDYHFLCAEGADETRHLHGQIWINNPREKGQVQTALQRIYQRTIDPTPAEIKVLRAGVKIAYSADFVENYLSKEDSWISNDPPENEDTFYPSKEEQQKVKDSSNAVDKKFHRLSEMFKEQNPDYKEIYGDLRRKVVMSKWILNQMFKEKTIVVISQKKHKTELMENLKCYVWSEATINAILTEKDYDLFKKFEENDLNY